MFVLQVEIQTRRHSLHFGESSARIRNDSSYLSLALQGVRGSSINHAIPVHFLFSCPCFTCPPAMVFVIHFGMHLPTRSLVDSRLSKRLCIQLELRIPIDRSADDPPLSPWMIISPGGSAGRMIDADLPLKIDCPRESSSFISKTQDAQDNHPRTSHGVGAKSDHARVRRSSYDSADWVEFATLPCVIGLIT